jgi:hypothetical protein
VNCTHEDCQGEHPGPDLLPDGRPRVITARIDCSAQIADNIAYGAGRVGGPRDES